MPKLTAIVRAPDGALLVLMTDGTLLRIAPDGSISETRAPSPAAGAAGRDVPGRAVGDRPQ